MLRFGRDKAETDNKKTPPFDISSAQRSEMDEIGIEWMTLDGRQITAARVSQMLEAAEQGNCQEQAALLQFIMDKEPIIAAHMQTRMLAVLGCGWCVESNASEEDRRAEEVETMLKKAGIYDLMRHLLDAIPTGYAGSRIDWRNSPKGGTGISGFTHVIPSNWLFDQGGNPGLWTTSGEKSLASYHPNQFVFHIHKMRPGLPCKGGLLRTLVWMWLFKRNAWKDRARFIEKFGIPMMVAKISKDDFNDNAMLERILNMLRNIGTMGASAITEGSEISNVTPSGQSSNADYHQFCKDIDDVFAILILGQLASSGEAKGFSKGQMQENVRLDILDSDCKNLMETVNRQIMNPLEQFKYGTEGELCFELEYEPEEDLQKKATLVETLYKAGRKAKKEWVEKTFDIPMDDVPDPVSVPPSPSPAQTLPALMDFADSTSAKFAGREEFFARLTENTLGRLFKSDEAMAEFYKPLYKEIRKTFSDINPDDPELIDKFRTRLAAFFDKYPALYETMDTSRMEKEMQGAMLASLVYGYTARRSL
jgi:phage gp29-like protein